MRWYTNPENKEGGTRTNSILFLFLPMTIGGETRWFEPVTFKEEYVKEERKNRFTGKKHDAYSWRPIKWVEDF